MLCGSILPPKPNSTWILNTALCGSPKMTAKMQSLMSCVIMMPRTRLSFVIAATKLTGWYSALIIEASLLSRYQVSLTKANAARRCRRFVMAVLKYVSRQMLRRAGLICLTLNLLYMRLCRKTQRLFCIALAEQAARAVKASAFLLFRIKRRGVLNVYYKARKLQPIGLTRPLLKMLSAKIMSVCLKA